MSASGTAVPPGAVTPEARNRSPVASTRPDDDPDGLVIVDGPVVEEGFELAEVLGSEQHRCDDERSDDRVPQALHSLFQSAITWPKQARPLGTHAP